MRVDPMPNIRTDCVQLRRERFEGREVPRRGSLSFFTHGTRELLSQFEGSSINPPTLEGLDHVFRVAVACSAMKKVQLFTDSFIFLPTLLLPALGLRGIGLLLWALGCWEPKVLQFLKLTG